MQETITLAPSAHAETPRFSRGRLAVLAGFAALAFLWFILCRHLSHEWSANEQYGYGWFVPFFAAFLFWLRWEERPGKVESRNAEVEIGKGEAEKGDGRASKVENDVSAPSHFLLSTFYFLLLALLLPLRLFEVGNPDWRPLGWMHAAIVVGATLLFLQQIGGRAWVRHFAFPVAFIFVAVPWVTPIEGPIVQGLMRIVAAIATETLALLGIPAQLEGSVIRIRSGVVGVNEACSGVRSLQTSLMIGLLFGELKRLSVGRRIGLVAAAAGIAFAANCARTIFLVWIATERGVGAVDQWHDTAGYAILGAVFLGTMMLAWRLDKKGESRKAKVEISTAAIRISHFSTFRLPTLYLLLSLPFLLAVEGAVEAWYRVHERDLVATPTWSVRWPESVPGFREVKIEDTVKAMLRYDDGRQASWPLSAEMTAAGPAAAPVSGTSSMFFFRWEPGTTNILRARAHRPDICLPNIGWRMAADHGVRQYRLAGGAEMPFRHFTFTRALDGSRAVTAQAFFCEREDRVSPSEVEQYASSAGAAPAWSRSDRLRVVRQGLRNQGQQVLEVVLMTAQPMSGPEAEDWFARLAPQIVEVGGGK